MTTQQTVHFQHGTRVRVPAGTSDPARTALDLLHQEGPVIPGTDQADFDITERPDLGGFVVHTHHPDIDTFVPDDLAAELGPPIPGWGHIKVGLLGRRLRAGDVEAPMVVDITDG